MHLDVWKRSYQLAPLILLTFTTGACVSLRTKAPDGSSRQSPELVRKADGTGAVNRGEGTKDSFGQNPTSDNPLTGQTGCRCGRRNRVPLTITTPNCY